ncbi:hypothetical protein [Geothermobacter ehrlichii]|uniref:hypothetical protein n=1 Tax=Geothermobacter ehrlichii TaxID=213224 RepID=UPI001652BA7B|nr:hypothetical protein [Geothermobacter ehrlichii]
MVAIPLRSKEKQNILKAEFIRKENRMDIWLMLGVVAVWVILQKWILPKMGVPT